MKTTKKNTISFVKNQLGSNKVWVLTKEIVFFLVVFILVCHQYAHFL